MNTDEIRALASLMADTGLTLLELDERGTHIKLERAAQSAPQTAQPSAVSPAAEPAVSGDTRGIDFNDVVPVNSPLVGIFYASAQPGGEPFVHVGDHVKKGDVLCIIEAMKLMNEITAPQDGEIVDVCAENGAVVEFGQTLFRLF